MRSPTWRDLSPRNPGRILNLAEDVHSVTIQDFFDVLNDFGLTLRPCSRRDDPPEGAHLFQSAAGDALWVKETAQVVSIYRPGAWLCLDLLRWEGEACLSTATDVIDFFLIIFFHWLLGQQGLLLHASGVLWQERAHLFPGSSGVGKSTIVSLSPRKKSLGGDMVAALPGEHGGFGAESIPYLQDWTGPVAPLAAPIKGLYFPVQSRDNFLAGLQPSQILKRLLPCLLLFTTWGPRLQQVFESATRLATEVPGYELHFRPEPSFWEVIDAP
jgi:hypothetical protein